MERRRAKAFRVSLVSGVAKPYIKSSILGEHTMLVTAQRKARVSEKDLSRVRYLHLISPSLPWATMRKTTKTKVSVRGGALRMEL